MWNKLISWFKREEVPLKVGGVYQFKSDNPFHNTFYTQIKALKAGWVQYTFLGYKAAWSLPEEVFKSCYKPAGGNHDTISI